MDKPGSIVGGDIVREDDVVGLRDVDEVKGAFIGHVLECGTGYSAELLKVLTEELADE